MKQRIIQEIKHLQRRKRIFKLKLFFTVTLPFLLFSIGFRIIKEIIRIQLKEAAVKAENPALRGQSRVPYQQQDLGKPESPDSVSVCESVEPCAGTADIVIEDDVE